MLHTIKEIVLINAYWFSIALTGYGILRLAKDRVSAHSRFLAAVDFVLGRHAISKFFMSFAFATSILAVGALICYLFSLPVFYFTGLYIILLVAGVGYLAKLAFSRLFATNDLNILGLKGTALFTKVVFVILCCVIVADFLLALYAKSHLAMSSDAYVHLSRIVAILNQGFTVQSGFFSDLPESGYHMNVIYALYTVPAELFNLQPSHIWGYSFGFFRLLQWTAIFTVAWHAITYWFNDKRNALLGASVITIFAVGFFASNFFIATYPNQIALTWLALLVIALSNFEMRNKGAYVPVLLTALLVTMTHPTYALMSSMFVALIFVMRWWQQKKGWLHGALETRVYVTTFFVLLIGPLRTALFPNRMTEAGFHIDDFPTWTVGPLSMKRPDSLVDGPLLYALLIMLGSVGLFYLLYRLRKNRSQFSLVLALVLFFPLIVYVPFVFTVMNKVLPMWVISRFMAMNTLTFIAVPVGIFAILHLLYHMAKKYSSLSGRVLDSQAVHALPVLLVLLVAGYSLKFAPSAITKYHDENDHYYVFMDNTYNHFNGVLKDNALVVANAGDSYFLASVLPIDVVAIEEGHTTPTADVSDRIACGSTLMKRLSYADLKAVGADYVALSVYSPGFKQDKKKADSASYLRRAAADGNFIIYAFDATKQSSEGAGTPVKACTEFKKVEQNQ